MTLSIKHFMWGYQPNFRLKTRIRAESIFQSLDPRFNPEVFLVGVLVQEQEGCYPACVEPENNFWIESEAFNGALERAKAIVPSFPESELFHSHPLVQKWEDERLLKKALQESIIETITTCSGRPKGMRYFPSWPVPVAGYWVTAIVGLQEEIIQTYPTLTVDKVHLHEYRSFKVSVSLIDAVMYEYLRDVAGELIKPDAGAGFDGKSTDEVLRSAVQRMMTGGAQRADTWDNQEGHEELLFDACNRLASAPYERNPSKGQLIVARRDHPCVEDTITFRKPVSVTNKRALRKLLELTSEEMALHMNGKDVWGLAKPLAYSGDSEDLFEIHVNDHQWDLVHAGKTLMHVCNGIPSLPKPAVDHDRLRTNLRRIFKGIPEDSIELFVTLVEKAAKEVHGTMLLISEKASDEADRLKKQSTPLVPCKLTPDLLDHLTSIDGAVLLGTDGVCHAIGVILDGLAVEDGDPARGARFNSALRYIGTRKEACMAIVVSEDGGVDMVPD